MIDPPPAPRPLTPRLLDEVEERLVHARASGTRWARLEDAEALARALRATWNRWPALRPPVPGGDERGPGRALASAFGGRTWDVLSAPAAMAEAGGDVAEAASLLGTTAYDLGLFMEEYYPGWRTRVWGVTRIEEEEKKDGG